VGDEAFWLLSGFASRWSPRPAPFVFLTDFIGTRAMTSRLGERLSSWLQNLRFSMSHLGPDEYVYIGHPEEIPDERLGLLLPRRRAWARRHCRFVKPIIGFDPADLPARPSLRHALGLPREGRVFLGTVGPHGDHRARTAYLEDVLDRLRPAHPGATFLLVCPEPGPKAWILYHRHLERLHEYFAASDLVLTESGYGKVAELLALGVPFVAIPLDRHFEQEHYMAFRLRHYGAGRLVTMRDHRPEDVAAAAESLLARDHPRVPVDDGSEVAEIVLRAARG
jgi:hypothetical protein